MHHRRRVEWRRRVTRSATGQQKRRAPARRRDGCARTHVRSTDGRRTGDGDGDGWDAGKSTTDRRNSIGSFVFVLFFCFVIFLCVFFYDLYYRTPVIRGNSILPVGAVRFFLFFFHYFTVSNFVSSNCRKTATCKLRERRIRPIAYIGTS